MSSAYQREILTTNTYSQPSMYNILFCIDVVPSVDHTENQVSSSQDVMSSQRGMKSFVFVFCVCISFQCFVYVNDCF